MWRVLALCLLTVTVAAAQTQSDVHRWLYEAEHGDARAQFWLGASYERGAGVGQNFAEALRWLAQSATQGNADAQNLLGQMYEEGEGVLLNYAQAAMWYGAACEHRPDYGGAGQGCNNLGLLYLEAQGLAENNVEAYKYFKLGGSTENLAVVMSKMTQAEVAEAEQETEQWFSRIPSNELRDHAAMFIVNVKFPYRRLRQPSWFNDCTSRHTIRAGLWNLRRNGVVSRTFSGNSRTASNITARPPFLGLKRSRSLTYRFRWDTCSLSVCMQSRSQRSVTFTCIMLTMPSARSFIGPGNGRTRTMFTLLNPAERKNGALWHSVISCASTAT